MPLCKSRGYAFQMEIAVRAKRMGYTIEEVSKHNTEILSSTCCGAFRCCATPGTIPCISMAAASAVCLGWVDVPGGQAGQLRPVGRRPECVGKRQLPQRAQLGFDC